MSSGNKYERLVKLWAAVLKMVIDGTRSIDSVIEALQRIVDESSLRKLVLYLHPTQELGGEVSASEIEKHLTATGRIKRALSADSPEVVHWIDNPRCYPDDYKGKRIFLWGSLEKTADGHTVLYLTWDRRVYIGKLRVNSLMDFSAPALLYPE